MLSNFSQEQPLASSTHACVRAASFPPSTLNLLRDSLPSTSIKCCLLALSKSLLCRVTFKFAKRYWLVYKATSRASSALANRYVCIPPLVAASGPAVPCPSQERTLAASNFKREHGLVECPVLQHVLFSSMHGFIIVGVCDRHSVPPAAGKDLLHRLQGESFENPK